jgi:hypothetical protein
MDALKIIPRNQNTFVNNRMINIDAGKFITREILASAAYIVYYTYVKTGSFNISE